VPYKRVDLVVEAFNATGLPLVVIGDGPERQRLEAMAGPTVRLLGRLPQPEVNQWLARCRAYVYAGLEDFGIAPVEAMGGGALDTVLPGVTGEHFAEQSVESLREVLEGFDPAAYDSAVCRRQAEQFGRQIFRGKLLQFVAQVMA